VTGDGRAATSAGGLILTLLEGMGISNLLQHLKGITRPVLLSELRGLRVAVDGYGWLHRGAFACCTDLCLGVDTDRHIQYCMRRVEMLLSNGIDPVIVFDGAALPAKQGIGQARTAARKRNRAKAEAALQAGEDAAADVHFSKAVVVTHLTARKLIKALILRGVRYIVAPYEADAQLAYLSMAGLVDAVLTEDSDSLPYGCKRVLFKLENDGSAQEIRRRDLAANNSPSFAGWTQSMFLDMCLLAGCDYLPSVRGLGLITAHRLVDRYRDYHTILAQLRSSTSSFELPDGYEQAYERARYTFRHQTVYDPRSCRTVPLMPYGENARALGDLSFLGRLLTPTTAAGVATSTLDPHTHQPYSDPLPSPTEMGDGGDAPGADVNRKAVSGEQQEQLVDAHQLPPPPGQLMQPGTLQGEGRVDSLRAGSISASLQASHHPLPMLPGEIRMKSIASIAQHFETNFVSPSLETLQRKRRRSFAQSGGLNSTSDSAAGRVKPEDRLAWLREAREAEGGSWQRLDLAQDIPAPQPGKQWLAHQEGDEVAANPGASRGCSSNNNPCTRSGLEFVPLALWDQASAMRGHPVPEAEDDWQAGRPPSPSRIGGLLGAVAGPQVPPLALGGSALERRWDSRVEGEALAWEPARNSNHKGQDGLWGFSSGNRMAR
jgi:5'-3' exonuclease